MKRIASFCVVFLFVGCFHSFEVIEDYDEFNGKTTYKMDGNLIDGSSGATLLGGGRIELNGIKTKRGNEEHYYLQLLLVSSVWYYIEDGNSIIFLIDGQTFSLSTKRENMYSDVWPGGTINPLPSTVEKVFYDTDKDFLDRIILAKSVKVKITSQKGYITRELKKENQENFKTFLARVSR